MSGSAAWFATAAVFLTAPFLLHAFTVFPDGPGGACVMAGLWLLVSLEMGVRVRTRSLALVGLALGCLPWLHTRFAVLAGCLGLAILARLFSGQQRVARISAFLAAPALQGAAWFAFFWAIWGTLNPSAPYGHTVGLQLRNVWAGLQGVMIDQQYGVWPTAPIYLFAIAGLVALFPRRRLTAGIVAAGGAYAVAVAAHDMWWGGFGGPARFLVAALPLTLLPLASLWARGGSAWRAVMFLFLGVSMLMLLARLAVNGGAMAYAETYGADPLLAWAARSVDLSAAVPSLRAASAWQDALAWLLIAASVAGAMTVISRRAALGTGGEWALVSLSAALVVMTASTAVWAVHHRDGLAPAKSQLAFVGDWHPEWQSLDLQWRKPYRVGPTQLLRRIEVPAEKRDAAHRTAAVFMAPPMGAADYQITVDGSRPWRGELVASVGKGGQPAERWRLEDLAADQSTLSFRLPVPVSEIRVAGDDAALSSIRHVGLRVGALDARAPRDVLPAHAAIRYGRLRAFFLDDRSYVEPNGFWTRGGTTMTAVIDPDDDAASGVTVRVQSGPVATTADLAVGSWTAHVNLGPEQWQDVVLPASADGRDRVLSIRTGSMFLPVEHNTRSRDFRHLGVWVELR